MDSHEVRSPVGLDDGMGPPGLRASSDCVGTEVACQAECKTQKAERRC